MKKQVLRIWTNPRSSGSNLVHEKRIPGLLRVFFITLFLSGCFASRPLEDAGFRPIESLHDLAGTYRNLGERDDESPPRYLSAIIWPNSGELDHEAVITVEVAVSDENTLAVKALGTDRVEKEGAFVNGKFNLLELAGRIIYIPFFGLILGGQCE